ncbi:ipt tig domain containing protein [Stylonychia lemnae]|uniref:Ipt tig domain containing protein n=1 Tax=Stylonychia lemnae TaxID=5949 RepID=A0A078AJC8_STYLE|nr:ipt tig domain containing protein [Stylonychia lemnae]|eukprot:CDW80878.1 ipt tig domain containing protein [Stylonychia lemnae]
MFQGQGMSMTAENFQVLFTKQDLNFEGAGQPVSKDNSFNSNTRNGKLQYTTPSIMTLFETTYDKLDSVEQISFDLSLIDSNPTTARVNQLLCNQNHGQKCRITMSRSYTPILYFMQPRVVYHGSETSFYVDPKSSQNFRLEHDLPFVEGRIDGRTLDFEEFVSEDTVFTAWTKNSIRAKVFDIPPNRSSQVNLKWRVGNSLHKDTQMVQCDVENKNCYKVKVVPVISKLSSNAGYNTGGQILQIDGYGFQSDNISIIIDGIECKVLSHSLKKLTCKTGAQPKSSTDQFFVGSNGLKRSFYNITDQSIGQSWSRLVSENLQEISIALSFETQRNQMDGYSGNIFKGYFKPPTSGRYRFYMACDDACFLFMNVNGTNTKDPAGAIQLMNSGYTSYRNYLNPDDTKRVTEWLNLSADSYYYIEGRHLQYTGGDEMVVSVEIDLNFPGHQNAMKEIQRLRVDPENIREQHKIVIKNPDSGDFNMGFQIPGESTLYIAKINSRATADQVRISLNSYWSSYFGCTISVALVMQDASGNKVQNMQNSVVNTYTISINKAQNKNTLTSQPAIQLLSSKSIILFLRVTQKSTQQLAGSFIIKCALQDGSLNTTADIQALYSPSQIKTAIEKACPNYKDKIDIWDGTAYSYYVDGRDIMIRFTDINSDIPQFIIDNSTTNAIIGANVSFSYQTTKQYGESLFYEPVPFEFIYTQEDKPQVLVTVDGLPAVCSSLDCDYSYISSDSQISQFYLQGLRLTIEGTNLPDTSKIQSVQFSNVNCAIQSASGTQVVCNLPSKVAGSWEPFLTDDKGLIRVYEATGNVFLDDNSIFVPLIVSGISPSSGINPNGGSKLKIIGENFPTSINDGSSISISFADSQQCEIFSSTATLIKCILPKFAQTGTQSVIVIVNGQKDNSFSIEISQNPASLISLTPEYVSPVLKQLILIQVDPSFNGVLDMNELTVTLVNVDASNAFSKQINVVGVNNTAKTITVKYGGIYSGIYNVNVFTDAYGMLDNSAVQLKALGEVQSISPPSGSIYGGTLITITGRVFSTDPTDNPVRIGSTDCLVESSSSSQIVCRTQPRNPSQISDTLIAFLKTSEEAVCSTGNDCNFTWLLDSELPELTNFEQNSVSFNADIKEYQVTLIGTNFPTTVSDVIFQIDGFAQTIISASETKIVVAITNILSQNSKNIQFYLPSGTPKGADLLTSIGINLEPIIISISPSHGSSGGSLVTAIVKGLGILSTDVTLTSNNRDICESVSIAEYGVLGCQTKLISISAQDLQVKVNNLTYSCTIPSQCVYETSESMPSISSISLVTGSTQMVILGTNFLTIGYLATVKFQGLEADLVTIDSDSQVSATWNHGVPLSANPVAPILVFSSLISSSIKHTASGTATISNTFSQTSINQNVDCSFAGGCLLQINQPGLASTLTQNQNSVRICDKICQLDAVESSSTIMKCKVSKLSTTYSVTKFKIEEESYITGSLFVSNTTGITALLDDDNQTPYIDSVSSNCYFGISFAEGHVGQISEVKYFMPVFVKANFVGNLKFQGSEDGLTYTDIFIVGQEIHEGWNYYSYKDNNLKYRYYKFQGYRIGSCRVGELKFRGIETIDNNDDSYNCPVTVNLQGQSPIQLTGSVTYKAALTPKLLSITPRYGKVQGCETITLNGESFSSLISDYSIKIDNIQCTVQTATPTQVTCITGKRPGLFPTPTLEFNIKGQGNIASQGKVFRYVNYWSLFDTWGGEFLPIEGESVYVPAGLHLLVDIDSTPILNAVVVEGSLIFPPSADPEYHRTFDAHYVMLEGGYMEVGTEEFPYNSRLTITMHSNKESPELPIYGNKCIAVRNSILELHGVPRFPAWTSLASTAEIGATQVTLIQAIDWKAGEEIVIAPTGYDSREAEVRRIVSIDRRNLNKPIITLDWPLQYKHYSNIEYYEDNFIEMRAEVGLLTRNVVYRGDPETSSKNQFGAHIMLHSHGDESVIGRIEYIELKDVGQAFQLGRYPIHFHLIGTVHNSYIRGNSIHHTYNRAVTIHGTHYLRVINNVAYHTMGHTFFIEDAVETKNLIQGNLAIQTMASMSLLITDQTPASFWITHPDNIFKDNHAAGSDRYGFWFDTQPNPTGPSYSSDICPQYAQLGEFSNNVAHSNGKYGLRIFHKLISRQNPCLPLIYNETNVEDPYHQNPLVTSYFINLTSWKNVRNGAIAEQVGDVRFVNFKVADNLVGGIEFSLTGDVADGYAQIIDALVIGHSQNAEQITMDSTFHGIITPRSENFTVNGAKFYNFDQPGHACFGSCSHCFFPASTDSGARTVTFQRIYFHSTATTKIKYQYPFRDIFFDLDGSLTGKGPHTWATPFWQHNVQPECEVDLAVYDGIICDSTVQIRRLVHYNYAPKIFDNMEMKVLKFDDNLYTDKYDFITTRNYLTDYSIVPFRPKINPVNHWAMPYVTGHKYKIHWRFGLDFTQMQIDLSNRWTTSDKDIYFMYNFTDVRAKVEFISGESIQNNATLLNKVQNMLQTGDNVVYNDSETREIHTIFNGRNLTKKSLVMKGYRCIGSCLSPISDQNNVESIFRRWSDPSSWPNGKVPTDGENVVIEAGWNMLYDVQNSAGPILKMLQINGRLTFDNEDEKGKNLYLYAKYIFVRAGALIIGNETKQFQGVANIVLYGEKANEQIVYDQAIEAGNKILVNTGNISIYGLARNKLTRLRESVYQGDKKLLVDVGLEWKSGERIALAATTLRYLDSDYAIIENYDNSTGILTIKTGLTSYHYGAKDSTGPTHNGIDMRGEVHLLSRNVKIQGNNSEAWGCQILTSDFVEMNGAIRSGHTYMNNVEIYNCSQYDTFKAEIANSAIYTGWGYGAQFEDAANVKLTNNSFYFFVKKGINIQSSSVNLSIKQQSIQNITLDGNHVMHVSERTFIKMDRVFEPTGGILVCTELGDTCLDISLVNNVVSGAPFTGYAMYGYACGEKDSNVFRDNIAHSIKDTGAIIFANKSDPRQFTCMQASRFAAYKCGLDGAIAFNHQAYKKIIFSQMTFIDNGYGGTPMVAIEGDDLEAEMRDSFFYGESDARDCMIENECHTQNSYACIHKSALQLAYFAIEGKEPLPKSECLIPISKIKRDASYGGKTTYTNLQFFNFKSNKTYCGMQQVLFRLNQNATDYTPRARFISPRFENIHQDAMAHLYTPPDMWTTLDGCGDYPCTGPSNALLLFEGATFSGTIKPKDTYKTFQIIPNNKATVQGYSNCVNYPAWNANHCTSDNLGVLLFESTDDDRYKRMISPIYIVCNQTNSKNTLNTFSDHLWDGFYTSQLRLARWPTIIETGQANGTYKTYDIRYSGTLPSNQRFSLFADDSAVILRIDYTKTGSYIVTDFNGNTIDSNKWNDNIKQQDLLKSQRCGENRYLGVFNILEFFMPAGCKIMIKSIGFIKTLIRLDWNMDAFYSDGGTTKFIDRVAGALGIHASTIKIVAVYQGSVVIDFYIIPDNAAITASSIQKSIKNTLMSKPNAFGAPVLSVSADGTAIITDGKIVLDTNKNSGTDNSNGTASNDQSGPKSVNVDTKDSEKFVSVSSSSNNQDQVKLIVILVVIIVVILIGGIISYFIYQKYQKKHSDQNFMIVNEGTHSQIYTQRDASDLGEHEVYQQQYHPKSVNIYTTHTQKDWE